MNHKIITGITIIFIGLVFLADNFGIMNGMINISNVWPVFVIIGGLHVIFNKRSNSDQGE
jgi:hypothetical protein